MLHPTYQMIHSSLGGINPKRSLIPHSVELTCSDEEVCSVTPASGDTISTLQMNAIQLTSYSFLSNPGRSLRILRIV